MTVHQQEDSWILETDHTAYVFGLNSQGMLVHRYWGKRLFAPEDYPPALRSEGWASFNGPGQILPEEYPAYGGVKFIDPCLKVTFADGVRDADLAFKSASVSDPNSDAHLVIELQDRVYPLQVRLHYRVYAQHDILERWVEITNLDDRPVTLERAWSAQWHLPQGDSYRMKHLAGRWLDESHVISEPLTRGIKTLESRRITTSHHHNPWFAVDRGNADEDQGAVWFGALAWSGNWKLSAEVTDFGSTRINLGLNDWDFAWHLNSGETFTTPSSFGGYTSAGYGEASRTLHDFIRDRILPHGHVPHQILYNSWEATLFDVDETSQARLAELAARIGVELFVVDDGWFHRRNSDRAGLGDWWPDEDKFPNGLSPLINRVNALGMDLGLWIEPEMVNPDSDLYRAHPDWVIHFPTRPRSEARNQLILNLARTDVQEYILEKVDALLSQHHITFIKWDMNRNVSEPGWPDAPGDPRELWVRYVQGLYRIWGLLRDRHPNVTWQSCSGGGGRADLGILRLADQIWVSDNTEATARLRIQEGFSLIFPANTMEAWVTDANREEIPLDFRFHVSMCGSLGIGGHLGHWSDEDLKKAARWIAMYKELRPIIQLGDQFRLRSALENRFSAVQYLSKDRQDGVLFAFRTHLPEPVQLPTLTLRGLDPQARYEVEGVEGARSGLSWMESGLQLELSNFESTVRRIRRL